MTEWLRAFISALSSNSSSSSSSSSSSISSSSSSSSSTTSSSSCSSSSSSTISSKKNQSMKISINWSINCAQGLRHISSWPLWNTRYLNISYLVWQKATLYVTRWRQHGDVSMTGSDMNYILEINEEIQGGIGNQLCNIFPIHVCVGEYFPNIFQNWSRMWPFAYSM